MIEGRSKKKGISRERYVWGRKLVCHVGEFDSGDMSKSKKGGKLFEGTGRFENKIEAKIDMTMTCSGCPVQYEGRVNKKKSYYRSRHGHWSFEIYKGKLFSSPILYIKGGIDKEDSIGFDGMLLAEKRIIECSMDYAGKNNKTKEKK